MDYYNLSSQIISLDSEADNTLQCVNLTLVGDELAEGAEYFVVSVAAVSGPVQITDANTTVKILDNDCELIDCPYRFTIYTCMYVLRIYIYMYVCMHTQDISVYSVRHGLHVVD